MNEFEVPDTKEIAETFTFSTKETNDKMPLFIGGAVIIIAIAAFIFGIGAFLKKVNTGSDGVGVDVHGTWDCYALSAFGQIYLDEGDEMQKEYTVKIKDDRYELKRINSSEATETGIYTLGTSKKDDSSKVAIKTGKNAAGNLTFEGISEDANTYYMNKITLTPDSSRKETSDGKAYHYSYSTYVNDQDKDGAIIRQSDSNAKNDFQAALSLYCKKTS